MNARMRESIGVCVGEKDKLRETENGSVCMSVCVCVCERERERERMRMQ